MIGRHVPWRLVPWRLAIVVAAATLSLVAAASAVELDPAAVTWLSPDQFKWRDPADAATNRTILHGDPDKPELYIYINTFKPGRFGNPHHHPNDRFITVIDGAAWRGTGPVLDPAHSTRVPRGTFMIDHAMKVHWDGTKEESGAYLIAGIGPASNIPNPKSNEPWSGGDPSAATIMLPDQIPWKNRDGIPVAALAGNPDNPGLFVEMLTLPKGSSFSPPHVHPGPLYTYVLSGKWWIGTGTRFDPDTLAVPMKAGTFVTHYGNRVHWDGARDEDVTLLIIGEGPVTTALVRETR
jgi:quercetin dioxygenase-like cupin family protein